MFPSESDLTICFAHVAYQMQQRFDCASAASRTSRIARPARCTVGEADVLVISGLWHNGLIARATKLRFIQSIGSGTDQFDRAGARGAWRPAGERAGRQCACCVGACDVADPVSGAAAAGGA